MKTAVYTPSGGLERLLPCSLRGSGSSPAGMLLLGFSLQS